MVEYIFSVEFCDKLKTLPIIRNVKHSTGTYTVIIAFIYYCDFDLDLNAILIHNIQKNPV